MCVGGCVCLCMHGFKLKRVFVHIHVFVYVRVSVRTHAPGLSSQSSSRPFFCLAPCQTNDDLLTIDGPRWVGYYTFNDNKVGNYYVTFAEAFFLDSLNSFSRPVLSSVC